MFMWRSDKQLMEESLKKAFSVRASASDERFARLIRQLREQDEQLKQKRRSQQPA